MKTVAILDGDLILFRAAAAVQAVYRWDNGAESISASFPKAQEKAREFIHQYARDVEADRVVLALSDPSSRYWRHQVLPSYKSSRTGVKKPVLCRNLREWAEDEFECEWRPLAEGDDILSILVTHKEKYAPDRKVAVTVDHDALQMPGLLFRPHRRKEGIIEITLEQADRAHLVQALAGDAGDCYFGVPGVGPAKAEKILDGWLPKGGHHTGTAWQRIVAAYERAGMSEAEALVQARVARILRADEYHQALGFKLWSPDGL